MNILKKSNSSWETILRYMLGISMLPYGLVKIFKLQFALPSYVLEEPLRNIDGFTLTWAFLGYSPWFSILLGFLEAIPAVLLLFRKTRLLGAVLLFPVLLTVFLINITYNFALPLIILSTVLLTINLTLLLFHYKLFNEFFNKLIYNQTSRKTTGPELFVNAILVILLSVVTLLISTKFFT